MLTSSNCSSFPSKRQLDTKINADFHLNKGRPNKKENGYVVQSRRQATMQKIAELCVVVVVIFLLLFCLVSRRFETKTLQKCCMNRNTEMKEYTERKNRRNWIKTWEEIKQSVNLLNLSDCFPLFFAVYCWLLCVCLFAFFHLFSLAPLRANYCLCTCTSR